MPPLQKNPFLNVGFLQILIEIYWREFWKIFDLKFANENVVRSLLEILYSYYNVTPFILFIYFLSLSIIYASFLLFPFSLYSLWEIIV